MSVRHVSLVGLVVSIATMQNGTAWKTEGLLPAKAQFSTYAGKFCFDYVPDGEVERQQLAEKSQELLHACEVGLTTQFSEHACVLDETYGCETNEDGIMWVSHGCRGDFVLNGSPLTCDSWDEQLSRCKMPLTPTSGYLEVDVEGQMLEDAAEHLFLMLFDDESEHWARAKENLDTLTCQDMQELANGAYPISAVLQSAPYHVHHLIRIREHLRPRFWHFVFVNCGAKNVLLPAKYALHARNIRQGLDAEFGIDAYKSIPLEVLFCMLFNAVCLAAFLKIWKRMRSHPLLCLLSASSCCSAAGCCFVAIHHRVYAYNGHGFILAGVVGVSCSCVAKSLLIILQFVIARGWALFFASEERSQLLVIVSALFCFAGITMGCELYGWYAQDSTTDLYLYESWPGIASLMINSSLLAAAWLFTLKSVSRETSQVVRMFYLRVSASAGIYFATLPVVCLLGSLCVPWVRQKYTERAELCARLVSTALLLLQLWPSHVDTIVSFRMKGRVGSLTHDNEDLSVMVMDADGLFLDFRSGDDEERVLTSKEMGLEEDLCVQ